MPAPVGHAPSPTWRPCPAITGRAFGQPSETPILVKAITGPAPTALTSGGAASRKTGEGSRSRIVDRCERSVGRGLPAAASHAAHRAGVGHRRTHVTFRCRTGGDGRLAPPRRH